MSTLAGVVMECPRSLSQRVHHHRRRRRRALPSATVGRVLLCAGLFLNVAVVHVHAERYLSRQFNYSTDTFHNLSHYFTALTTFNERNDSTWTTTLREQSSVSFVDDTPMDRIKLPFRFPFLSGSYSHLYVNPNGGISFDAEVPCSCCFMGSNCDLSNSYQTWVAAFIADFNPAEMMDIMAAEEYLAALAWEAALNGEDPVSYTHLTLPTIYSV